jgi:hypothetical protein
MGSERAPTRGVLVRGGAIVPMLIACACASAVERSTTPWDAYYCPRSSVLLQWLPAAPGKNGLGSYRVAFEPFPRDAEKIGKGGHVLMHGGFVLQDCSDDQFLCMQISGREDVVRDHYIFVPRTVIPLHNYEFRGMRAVSGSNYYSRAGALPITIWQKFGEKLVPITVTVEDRRGVVYWDGIDFWSRDQRSAEMCVLQGARGIFADVRVNAPLAPPPLDEDD